MKRSETSPRRTTKQRRARAHEPARNPGAKSMFAELFGPRRSSGTAANSPEDRQQILLRMQMACSMFYGAAVQAGCHAFIEFTGLMQTFIDGCRDAEAGDLEWVHANVHGGNHLPLVEHQVAYLREKLECIYGGTFHIVPHEPKRAAPALRGGPPRGQRRPGPARAARA